MKFSGFARRTWEFLKKNVPVVLDIPDSPDRRILLAVSGGPDSMALLEVVCELRRIFKNTSFEVAHVNYGLRESASRDEEIVRKKARDYGFELNLLKLTKEEVEKGASAQKISIEMYARKLRYDFFKLLVKNKSFDFVFLGHTLSDLVETIILHLTKGASLSSLEGIPVRRGVFVRPILWATRGDVLSYLSSRGVCYGIDETNLNPEYTYRNFIRHRVIPLLKEINPSFEKTIAHLSIQARDENRYWFRKLRRHLRILENGGSVSLPDVALKRLIFFFLKKHSMDVSFEKIDRISALLSAPVSGKFVRTERGNFFSMVRKGKPALFFVWDEKDIRRRLKSKSLFGYLMENGRIDLGPYVLLREGTPVEDTFLRNSVKVAELTLPSVEGEWEISFSWRLFSQKFFNSAVSGMKGILSKGGFVNWSTVKKRSERLPVNLRYSLPFLVLLGHNSFIGRSPSGGRDTEPPGLLVVFAPVESFSFPENFSLETIYFYRSASRSEGLLTGARGSFPSFILLLKKEFLNFEF